MPWLVGMHVHTEFPFVLLVISVQSARTTYFLMYNR